MIVKDLSSIEELRIDNKYASLVLSEQHDDENIPRIRTHMLPTKDLNNLIKRQFSYYDKPFMLPSNCKFFNTINQKFNIA